MILSNGLEVLEKVSLWPFTTMQVGGEAAFFAQPHREDELRGLLSWREKKALPLYVLGGGSNVVVADDGLEGLVLQWRDQSKQVISDDGNDVLVRVGGGHDWDELVAWSVEEGLAGLECLSGIPGCVGASPIQNIGAYGQELCESFVSACVVDLHVLAENMELEEWDRERCAFGYRDSAFKRSVPGRWLVLSVVLRLRRGGEPALRYAELTRTVEALPGWNEADISPRERLQLVRDTVIRLRRRKSMVVDASDPNSRSAGSFFVNPVVSVVKAKEVWERMGPFLGEGVTMPQFPAPDGQIKLAAGWLIEKSGLVKGCSWGHVGLSAHHALALINRGGATAFELLQFARFVQLHVEKVSGVTLHPEPRFLGFPANDLSAFVAPTWEEVEGLERRHWSVKGL